MRQFSQPPFVSLDVAVYVTALEVFVFLFRCAACPSCHVTACAGDLVERFLELQSREKQEVRVACSSCARAVLSVSRAQINHHGFRIA